eukprot:m.18274 g.18274  ORF g.18274 m.18274 type:complete len:68 (-) comp3657_c0_seq1:62-265(-)
MPGRDVDDFPHRRLGRVGGDSDSGSDSDESDDSDSSDSCEEHADTEKTRALLSEAASAPAAEEAIPA